MFTHILHPTDFSEHSDHALGYALDLATASGANLHVMHVVAGETDYTASPELPPHVEKGLREQMHASVARQRTSLEAASRNEVQIKYTIIEGVKPEEAILRYARSRGMDLLVLGTHGRRGVRRLLLGSVVEAVIHNAAVPVLTVRPSKSEPSPRLQHILAPIDFSEYSTNALHYAKRLAAIFDARVSLLFVAEERMVPLFSDTGIPNFTMLKMEDDVVKNAPAALRALDEEVAADGVETEHLVRQGPVDNTILELVEEEQIDLIVMGSRGLGDSERRVLGNTTDNVVRSASVPVMVVPALEATSS